MRYTAVINNKNWSQPIDKTSDLYTYQPFYGCVITIINLYK